MIFDNLIVSCILFYIFVKIASIFLYNYAVKCGLSWCIEYIAFYTVLHCVQPSADNIHTYFYMITSISRPIGKSASLWSEGYGQVMIINTVNTNATARVIPAKNYRRWTQYNNLTFIHGRSIMLWGRVEGMGVCMVQGCWMG